jgi:hypothetical protein
MKHSVMTLSIMKHSVTIKNETLSVTKHMTLSIAGIKCRYAERHVFIVIRSVNMLSVVVMLSVVAPF